MKQPIAALFGAQTRLTSAEFDQVFLENYTRIVSAAYRLTGDPDAADELASDAFWKLWQNPPPKAENLSGWLYRVVTNLGYNYLRSARRRSDYENRAQRLEWVNELTGEPEDEVIQRQERASVRAVLKRMPQRDVQILILRSCGLSYKEIAEGLHIAVGSVGTLIARAERKFDSLYSLGEKHAPER